MAQIQTPIPAQAHVAAAEELPTPHAITAQPQTHVLHGSPQCPSQQQWFPFEWEEPERGKQVHGEATIARGFGTTGTLMAGLWRTGPTFPGCQADGSNRLRYSSPLGDETACIIDGTATLTVIATGKKYQVGPGSIISTPKGLEVQWDIDAPFFKKFWCVWAGSCSSPVTGSPLELQVNHVSDNPAEWIEYHFIEPKEGAQVCGELYFIRDRGSTGTMMSGVWRCGKGIEALNCQADGTVTTPSSGTLGDETILLLEGEVEVTETATGKKHEFRAGTSSG